MRARTANQIIVSAENAGREACRNGAFLSENPFPAPVDTGRFSTRFDEMASCFRAWAWGWRSTFAKDCGFTVDELERCEVADDDPLRTIVENGWAAWRDTFLNAGRNATDADPTRQAHAREWFAGSRSVSDPDPLVRAQAEFFFRHG